MIEKMREVDMLGSWREETRNGAGISCASVKSNGKGTRKENGNVKGSEKEKGNKEGSVNDEKRKEIERQNDLKLDVNELHQDFLGIAVVPHCQKKGDLYDEIHHIMKSCIGFLFEILRLALVLYVKLLVYVAAFMTNSVFFHAEGVSHLLKKYEENIYAR